MYNLLEEDNPRVMKVTAVTGSHSSSQASLEELACSFLHRIAARPKIIPYTDMVKWILDSAEIKNRKFKVHGQGLIGSFVAQDLKLINHLPEPQATYNTQFIVKFVKENQNLSETTKYWSRKDEPLKKDKHGMYSTGSLTSPYFFAAAMLCRIFGIPDIKKISSKWLPLLDVATNATIVDWAEILSDNLITTIFSYRSKRATSQRIYPPFYLAAYIMDSIFYVSKFPVMGWKWTTQDPLPIHVYHKILWDSQFTPYFYQICHGLMLPLYRMLYDKEPLRCSLESNIDILPIARWFGEELFTYVRVFGSIAPPHVLPLYIPDKLLWRR